MIEVLPETPPAPRDPTATAGARVRRVVRSWWWVGLLVVAVAVVGVLNSSNETDIRLHPRNPGPTGAMAAARILADKGVDIVEAGSVADALAAVDGPTTLLLADPSGMTAQALARVAGVAADVVVAGSPHLDLTPLTDAIQPTPAGGAATLRARCTDPAASAAGSISGSTGAVTALRDDVTICFPIVAGSGAYAVWRQDGQTWRYLADPTLMSNEALARDGNAALTLRSLGQHPRLVWFHPLRPDDGAAAAGRALPPWSAPVGVVLLGVVAMLALWQGRRMGRVVVEPLPVVVRPGESVRGRGRLYRRARAVAHAATGLRAGSAGRLGRRLGLPPAAGRDGLILAVARATGREPGAVAALLHGPSPTSEAGLLQLAAELAQLESEAHGVDR